MLGHIFLDLDTESTSYPIHIDTPRKPLLSRSNEVPRSQHAPYGHNLVKPLHHEKVWPVYSFAQSAILLFPSEGLASCFGVCFTIYISIPSGSSAWRTGHCVAGKLTSSFGIPRVAQHLLIGRTPDLRIRLVLFLHFALPLHQCL